MVLDERVSNALKNTRISELELSTLNEVPRTMPTSDVISLMVKDKFGCVLVKDGKDIVGVFTERDVLNQIAGQDIDRSRPIEDFMRPDPVTMTADMSLVDAVELMSSRKFRRLPVLDESGECIGVLFAWRIVNFLVEYFQEEVYHLPPNYENVFDTPEGG